MEKSVLGRPPSRLPRIGVALLAVAFSARLANAYTPESPEVEQLLNGAIQFLVKEGGSDTRLGAQALVGMALLKHGESAGHPRIVQAAAIIQNVVNQAADPASMQIDNEIYSGALSVIFLSMLDPNRHRSEILSLLAFLEAKQKSQGAWGYPVGHNAEKCDTSMTQNVVLCCWEATQAGFQIPEPMLDAVTTWLVRTQDPSGGFGYQGIVPDGPGLGPQSQIRPSMSAAGLGSLYILGDLLHLDKPAPKEDDGLPPALTEVKEKKPRSRSRVDARLVQQALARGIRWMEANYTINQGQSNFYYLYALERYHSFREAAEGRTVAEPQWYNDGVRLLKESQGQDGSWAGARSGPVPATAFAALFLLRSTKKSIEHKRSLGDGTLIVGRGLPRHLAGLTVLRGNVVAKPQLASLDKVLASLDDATSPQYAEALEVLAELPSEEAGDLVAKHLKMLKELAGDASAEARLAAVRALGKQRNLDHVPTLIYALTDPDPVVVREARNGLRRISRKFRGFGLPDEPTELERHAAKRNWQAWYRAIRPDAELED
ncbi:MAG: HEAT repeat domain-containing protein [Planctomycetota bacterium]